MILAKEIGYQFLDADLLIQQQENRLLKEIIAEEGADGFISIENRVNASIDANRTVIATGGSVVYGKRGDGTPPGNWNDDLFTAFLCIFEEASA